MAKIYNFMNADKALILGEREAFRWEMDQSVPPSKTVFGALINHSPSADEEAQITAETIQWDLDDTSDRFLIGFASSDFDPTTNEGSFVGIGTAVVSGETYQRITRNEDAIDPDTASYQNHSMSVITVSGGSLSETSLGSTYPIIMSITPVDDNIEQDGYSGQPFIGISVEKVVVGETETLTIKYKTTPALKDGKESVPANEFMGLVNEDDGGVTLTEWTTIATEVPWTGNIPDEIFLYSPLSGYRMSIHVLGYHY